MWIGLTVLSLLFGIALIIYAMKNVEVSVKTTTDVYVGKKRIEK